jgi:hypothetical protein
MPNVVVRTDTDNRGIRQFEWRTQTDAEGRFEWRSAPADPVLYWFEAETVHEVLRDIPLRADGTGYRVIYDGDTRNDLTRHSAKSTRLPCRLHRRSSRSDCQVYSAMKLARCNTLPTSARTS